MKDVLCLYLFGLQILLVVSSAGIKGPPRPNGKLETKHLAKTGDTIRLPCPVTGNPKPIMTWYKEGISVTSVWQRFKVTHKGLKISDVSSEDSGVYTCKAVNGFGSTTLILELTVLDVSSVDNLKDPESRSGNSGDTNLIHPQRPLFREVSPIDRMIEATPGSHIKLRCIAEGYPIPTIRWYKNGEELTLHPMEDPLGRHHLDSLNLIDLRTRDAGVYSCKASNYLGFTTENFTLEVIELRNKVPELMEYPVNTSVQAGEMTSLQCKVRSDEQPHIQWLKRVRDDKLRVTNRTLEFGKHHYQALNATDVISTDRDTFVSKYIFTSVRSKDAGIYICLAANSHGYNYREVEVFVADLLRLPEEEEEFPITAIIIVPVAIIIILACLAIAFLVRRRGKPSVDSPKSPGDGIKPVKHLTDEATQSEPLYLFEKTYAVPYQFCKQPDDPLFDTRSQFSVQHHYESPIDYQGSECSSPFSAVSTHRVKNYSPGPWRYKPYYHPQAILQWTHEDRSWTRSRSPLPQFV